MKPFLRKCIAVLSAVVVCLSVLAPAALAAGGQLYYSNTVDMTDGFAYQHTVSSNASGKLVERHTLTLEPDSEVYPIVIACDTIYGGMTLPTAAAYAEQIGYNVLAGTNADFGYWSTRIPCGMVVEDGIYKSSPDTCSVLGFGPDGAFLSLAPTVTFSLETADGETVTFTHYNKTRTADGLFLYSEYFSTVSTRTTSEGWAVRMRILDGEMRIGQSMTLQVESVTEGTEASYIGEGYLVLTAQQAAELSDVFEKFSVGDTLTLTSTPSDARLADTVWATGYGNTLVYDGQLYYPDGWDSSIASVNPRTCAGILEDGTLLVRVIDGRSSASAGVTLSELAQEMMDEGCRYVANLDGGGSSAIAVRQAGDDTVQIRNVPSDGTPRSCPSFLFFVTDTPADGEPARLFAQEDGIFLLAGSSVQLNYLATDAGLYTVDAPQDATATSSGLGSVSENIYTAGDKGGADVLTLSSDSHNITGSATMHIITRVDTLAARNTETGRSISSASLEQGQTLRLELVPGCLGRSVTFDADAAVWAVSGDAVEMTEPGVFTATGLPGAKSEITGTLGGRTVTVSVSIPVSFEDLAEHWAAEYVETLVTNGIVNGTSPTTFSPEAAMRRCDFTLMLWRAAGQPVPTGECTFTDVPADAYYAQAVAWAEQAGIAQGSGNGLFDPSGTLTREQAFTLVRRAFDVLGVTAPETPADLTALFEDAGDVADWAAAAAADLVAMGVVAGDGAQLYPKAELTRAQMAKIFCLVLTPAES